MDEVNTRRFSQNTPQLSFKSQEPKEEINVENQIDRLHLEKWEYRSVFLINWQMFQVPNVCALTKDFRQFPQGDMTMVGDRGVRGLFKKYREFYVFSKIIYLFMNTYFVPFKVIPIRYYTLVPRFFQSSKHFKKLFFVILFSSSFDAVFISSIVAQRRRSPFMGFFSFGNKKKSQGARSGEYGGCGIISVLFLVKNSRTSNVV